VDPGLKAREYFSGRGFKHLPNNVLSPLLLKEEVSSKKMTTEGARNKKFCWALSI
jgi:hypothetical protein